RSRGIRINLLGQGRAIRLSRHCRLRRLIWAIPVHPEVLLVGRRGRVRRWLWVCRSCSERVCGLWGWWWW
ncbi:hypothetical protein LTS18_014040, partial [Coniosporium uncinatum]